MYVYRTSSFNNELKKYQDLSLRVDNLCSKLQTMNFVAAQERFARIHSYLKRKEGNFRLIAKVIKVEKEPILCLLKVYVRGEPGYKHFLEVVKNQNFLFQESSLTPQLVKWLTQHKNQHPQITKAVLKEDLRVWLQRPDWKIYTDGIIIHESELWCQKFSQPKIRFHALFYRQLIEKLINEFDTIGSKTQWSNIRFYGQDQFYIIYSNIVTKDNPREQVLLLISPLVGVHDEKTIQNIIEPLLKQNTTLNWWQKNHNLKLEDLITYTKRSYPWYLISDDKFWLRIQDGNGVNLALSAEEKNLLHSVSTETSLPLFLNGRAGSGKSTMLFHLFAYYCNRHLQFCRENRQDLLIKPHPLFVTYSPNLSDFAKVKVQSLLRHHHHFIEETGDLDKIPNLGAFFQSFRSFLLKLLPISERANFTEENYVSFHKFRELFDARWQDLSAEKCWLVIQNFIKGYELVDKDSYLESVDKYRKIPKKEKTVTTEEFIEIRDTVWYWYHKHLQEHHLWDDRDLVRTILDLGYYKPQYTVIFCDEAQDFTRLELQLIMGLSVFSLYNLEQETIFSLPFAFAGDPLQTLNPTGFRWAGFKAAFHDEVLTPLHLTEPPKIQLELRQLKYNYRSAAAIVKVNNLIQLWRKLLFDFTDIKPQQAKKYNNFIPQKFIIGDNITLEHLQNTLKDTIILIPCDEGAEKEFILQDEVLKYFFQNTIVETPWNILSAIAAKGLEFKQVILYRFGEACNLHFGEHQFLATEEDKYFLNKLYVAASRATEKLFIIDSFEGEIKLWSYASDRNYLNYFLAQIDEIERQQWQENIDLIAVGNSFLDLSNSNLESDAFTFETVGINTENIKLINRAIAAYNKSQNKLKADFCLAWKLKLEREYLAAGELFLELNKVTEAWVCLWQAQSWDKLQQLILNLNEQNKEASRFKLLSPLINFMVTSSTTINLMPQNIVEITNFLATELKQNNLAEERDSKPWQTFLNSYSYQIQTSIIKPQLFSSDYWLQIASILISYLEESSPQIKQLIAQCLYLGKDYRNAVKYWEDLEDESSEIKESVPTQYYIAQAKLAKLPQGLKYLYQGKQYQTIIQQWLKTRASLESSWLEYVALAFEATSQDNNALNIYCYLNHLEQVQECWKKVNKHSTSLKQLKQLTKYYLKQQYWNEAINFAHQELNSLKLQCYFIYQLANSHLTPEKLTLPQRQKYQKFVKQYFLDNSLWQQYLTVEHLGIALEKIGSLVTTLSFYEQYINAENPQLQQFSRNRWLVIKKRQVDYFRAGVKLAKVQKSQRKLTINAHQWNLNPETISVEPPVIEKLTSFSNLFSPQKQLLPENQPTFTITGLPSKIEIKTGSSGIKQLQLNHLRLYIAKFTPKIAIVNLITHQKILINCRQGKIQLATSTFIASGNQPVFLSDTKGKYQIVLRRDFNPCLQLKLGNYTKIITIKFSNL